MGKLISYSKLGRSMPLTLAKCGTLGGDIEMTAALTTLANQRPDDTFYLVGRNSGESAEDAGLPKNVINPWVGWAPELRRKVAAAGLKGPLTVESQLKLQKIFDKITLDTMLMMDEHIIWVGQHGTSNAPIPKVEDPTQLTKPQDWCAWYAAFLLRGINHWRDVDPYAREEIYINADPRNRHKMRDLKWPLRHPILTQFTFDNAIKHHRYGDDRAPFYFDGSWERYAKKIDDQTWSSTVHNVYSRLELNALVPGTPSGDMLHFNDDWAGRQPFGLVINEARSIGVPEQLTRLRAMLDWVLPCHPTFVHGTWSPESMKKMQDSFHIQQITSLPWSKYESTMHSVRCTFTTPSSGSGWATTKPWEAFAAGVVCFFHPAYDTQNNILVDADPNLQSWLRVKDPKELKFRIDHLSTEAGRSDWEWLIAEQRRHFDKAMQELTYVQMINDRLDHKA